MIGDFKLSSISWPLSVNQGTSNPIEKHFVESFTDKGLDQCITEPTHIKGRTLDLLLTNNQSFISNLQILEKYYICESDNFPITFDLKTSFKLKPMPKRKIYNFKKANWQGMNHTLEQIPWEQVLGNKEPEYAWQNFKSILFYLVDLKHIPTITMKSAFSCPWFDSECYDAYRGEKRAHRFLSEKLIMKLS